MTANDQRRAHWTAVNRAKQQVQDTVYWLSRRAGIENLAPSAVTVTWFTPDKRKRDTDSLSPFLKATLDGLVKAGVWPDDHSDWVVETRMRIDKTDTRNPRLEIRITEVEMRTPISMAIGWYELTGRTKPVDQFRWWDLADCKSVGLDVFFSEERQESGKAFHAKKVCKQCPVVDDCLGAAMREEAALPDGLRFGVRGGLTGYERAKLARRDAV